MNVFFDLCKDAARLSINVFLLRLEPVVVIATLLSIANFIARRVCCISYSWILIKIVESNLLLLTEPSGNRVGIQGKVWQGNGGGPEKGSGWTGLRNPGVGVIFWGRSGGEGGG